MDDSIKYGMLLNSDITLHREYFKEMTRLIGIRVIYRAPREDKHYTTYNEIESNYYEPILTGCIFEEHPTQQTLKKMGWAAELQENASLIHVAYDLPKLQQGALFIVPCGLDQSQGRLFRVVKMTNGIVYPASITCEIVPEYQNNYNNAQTDYEHRDFNLLNGEENLLNLNSTVDPEEDE